VIGPVETVTLTRRDFAGVLGALQFARQAVELDEQALAVETLDELIVSLEKRLRREAVTAP
jgi:hypothetical protein